MILDYQHINTLSMLDAALYYASQGIRVFPCQVNDKKPTLQWKETATTNPDTITQWWTINPDQNIGAVMGNDIMAVDCDNKGGESGYQSYLDIGGDLDRPTQQTPSGGYHFIGTHADGMSNFTRKGSQGGLDMRTDGGYILVAPSAIDGNRYQWCQASAEVSSFSDQVLDSLRGFSSETAQVRDREDMPEIPSIESLPPVESIGLPSRVIDTLNGTAGSEDWSSELFIVCKMMLANGIPAGNVMSYLLDSDSVMDGVLRHTEENRAELWLWKYNLAKVIQQNQDRIADAFDGVNQQPQSETAQVSDVPPAESAMVRFKRMISECNDDAQRIVNVLVQAKEAGRLESEIETLIDESGLPKAALRKDYRAAINKLQSDRAEDQEGGAMLPWEHTTPEGMPKQCQENVIIACKREGVYFRMNEVGDYIETIPGCKSEYAIGLGDGKDYGMMVHRIAAKHRIDVQSRTAASYVSDEARRNSYHPMLELLNDPSNAWDGADRYSQLRDTVVVPENQMERWNIVLSKWMTGAVGVLENTLYEARMLKAVPVLVGGQNVGKTTWFSRLAPLPGLFIPGVQLQGTRDDAMKIGSSWIMELGEIESSLTRQKLAQVKAFLSTNIDEYRGFGVADRVRKPRRAAIVGTVNDREFLVDHTGNARFWPVDVEHIDLDAQRTIDMTQVWAQAWAWYKSGCTWDLTAEEAEMFMEAAKEYEVENPLESNLEKYYDWSEPKETWEFTSVVDIKQRLDIDPNTRPKLLNVALKRLGAKETASRLNDKKVRGWLVPSKIPPMTNTGFPGNVSPLRSVPKAEEKVIVDTPPTV